MSEFLAFCQFCDDIRSEVGNKTSLMGVYSGDMFVPQIPIVLPKLCATVFCRTKCGNEIISLSISVSSRQRGVITEASVDEATIQKLQARVHADESTDDPFEWINIGMNLTMSPFPIEAEDMLSVVVVANGEVLKAGRLRIRQAPELGLQDEPL